MRRKGFTLIELLVVIGIIGILAAGILAAIDPLEQLKKGRDSNKRSVCVEVFNALTRHYAVQGNFPWTSSVPYSANLSAGEVTVVDSLTAIGELKPEFMKGLPAGAETAITVYQATQTSPVYVCFDPESKAVSADPTTIYSSVTGQTGCAPAATSTCYWCAR